MAQAVYSLRIFAHASLSSAGGLVGPVVPSGFIYVLRDVDVFESSGTRPVTMVVNNPLAGVLVAFELAAGTVNGSLPWRGRQIYSPGERVGFQAFSGTWAIMASGYQLTLP